MLKINSNGEKEYYIPLEVTADTIIDFDIDPADVVWTKIGTRRVRAIMVPVTKAVYYAYMDPIWAEEKRIQRLRMYKERKYNPQQESKERLSVQGPIESLDEILEGSLVEPADPENLEISLEFKLSIEKIRDELDEEDFTIINMVAHNYRQAEIASIIGMSQRGISKRIQRIQQLLQGVLQDYNKD